MPDFLGTPKPSLINGNKNMPALDSRASSLSARAEIYSLLPDVTIPPELATPIASATALVDAASASIVALKQNLTDGSVAQVAQTAVDAALQTAHTAQDATTDATLVAFLGPLVNALTSASTAAAAAVSDLTHDTVVAAAIAMDNVEVESQVLKAALDTSGDACALTRRSTGQEHRRTFTTRASSPPCFALTYNSYIFCPNNEKSITPSQDCTCRDGNTYTYTLQQVIDALKQGARYHLGNQVATKSGYPHAFVNTPNVNTVTYDPACDLSQTVYEFPILNDGTLLNVGGSNRNKDVGTERVLFNVDAMGNTIYCGLVAHHTQDRVTDPVTGALLLPFTNCVPSP